MCLNLTKNAKVEIAVQPITVYKKFYDPSIDGTLYSPYYREPYKLGKTKRVRYFSGSSSIFDPQKRFKTRLPEEISQVNQGLHSYISKPTRKNEWAWYECEIPEGTAFIRGAHGEVVSLALTVKRKLRLGREKG